jgi:WXG100 family type VII secretion target
MDMSNVVQQGGGGAWEGMNPDVVEAQGRILGGLSEEVTALMNKIEGEVTQLADAWHGDDSKKFAAEWAGTHKPVFTTAATLLQTMSETSVRNASQQRSTSSS